MKNLFETAVGGDGAKLSIGLDQEDVAFMVRMPVMKLAEPALKAIDSAVDGLEHLIPGDQSELAVKIKAEIRSRFLEALKNQTEVASPAPAQVMAQDAVESESGQQA